MILHDDILMRTMSSTLYIWWTLSTSRKCAYQIYLQLQNRKSCNRWIRNNKHHLYGILFIYMVFTSTFSHQLLLAVRVYILARESSPKGFTRIRCSINMAIWNLRYNFSIPCVKVANTLVIYELWENWPCSDDIDTI